MSRVLGVKAKRNSEILSPKSDSHSPNSRSWSQYPPIIQAIVLGKHQTHPHHLQGWEQEYKLKAHTACIYSRNLQSKLKNVLSSV